MTAWAPLSICGKIGLSISAMLMPIVRLLRSARLRAVALGRYPSSAAARSIDSRLASLTFDEPRKAKDTNDFDTPARAATSWIVGFLSLISNVSHGYGAALANGDLARDSCAKRFRGGFRWARIRRTRDQIHEGTGLRSERSSEPVDESGVRVLINRYCWIVENVQRCARGDPGADGILATEDLQSHIVTASIVSGAADRRQDPRFSTGDDASRIKVPELGVGAFTPDLRCRLHSFDG